MCGCPSSGSIQAYRLIATDGTSENSVKVDYGRGVQFKVEQWSDSNTLSFFIEIRANVTVNNALYRPMLTTNLNATYDDFVQYTGSTGSLNSDVAELLKRVTALENN